MCDPVSLTVAAISGAGLAANKVAQNNAAKSQQSTMNANTAASAAQFDTRMGLARGSDQRVMGLEQDQYGETSDLQDQTFSYMLDQSKQRADTEDLAQRGLITAQQQNNDRRITLNAAESARQAGYLGDVAQTITNAASQIAGPAMAAKVSSMFSDRLGVLTNVMPAGTPSQGPTPAGDDLVGRAYATQAQAARDRVMGEATAGAHVGAARDAASWADQLQNGAGDTADAIKGRAGLSGQLAAADSANIDASDKLAQAHASFAQQLAQWQEQQNTGAYSDWSTKQGGVLGDYYGRNLQSENDYSTGMTGSSQHLEDTNTSLANYKISNTRADTTLGDALMLAGSAAGAAGASFGSMASAGKTALQKLTVRPMNIMSNVPGLVASPSGSLMMGA